MPNFIELIPQLQKCVVSQDNTSDKNCTKVVIKALNHLRSMTFVCSMHQRWNGALCLFKSSAYCHPYTKYNCIWNNFLLWVKCRLSCQYCQAIYFTVAYLFVKNTKPGTFMYVYWGYYYGDFQHLLFTVLAITYYIIFPLLFILYFLF